MMDYGNVFEYGGYSPRYYLRHPLKWVRDKWRELTWAKQRITRGYADCDVWNMDMWFASVIPAMMDQLADKASGWPSQKFETIEDWQQWLHNTAAAIKMMQEDAQDAINPYWPAYQEELHNWQGGYKPTEIANKYYDEAARIATNAQNKFEQAMTEMARNFSCLWD